MNLREKTLALHEKYRGKIETVPKVVLENFEDLSLAYTPGVAEPCKEINKNPELVYRYTLKGRTVAVVTDGSAVLGLGNIGPEAALPVMEGKAILFKAFAGVDAFPICLATQDTEVVVNTVKNIAPTFGGINLEDISAPRCFYIERRLKEELDIPVFHDDQHGTAVVVLAGVINALKIVNKDLKKVRIIINGAGAAGTATAKLLLKAGAGDVIICDRKGIIHAEREDLDWNKVELARITNKNGIRGTLSDAMRDSDVFIGVSTANVVTKEMVSSMTKDPIVFALANPVPEIFPEEAKAGGAIVVGTGRSDYPNQINNVLAFPGIFRGALEVRAKDINEEMMMAAAHAISSLVAPEELSPDYCIPSALDRKVAAYVASEVAKVAMDTGVSREVIDPEQLKKSMLEKSN